MNGAETYSTSDDLAMIASALKGIEFLEAATATNHVAQSAFQMTSGTDFLLDELLGKARPGR